MESMQFDMKMILVFAPFIGFGFMILNTYKHSLFEGKSFKLILINGDYHIFDPVFEYRQVQRSIIANYK
jgi:hypothetical protein